MLAVKADSGCYNIGTGVETSVLQLTDLLAGAIIDYSIDIEHTDRRDGEVQSISLDISHSRDSLQWSPKMDIRRGIEQTWKWFLEAQANSTAKPSISD